MSQEADLINWVERFSQWTFAAAEPSANASRSAQDTIAGTELLGMAQTLVDGLLQGGYAPKPSCRRNRARSLSDIRRDDSLLRARRLLNDLTAIQYSSLEIAVIPG